jgi:hypothetical protein
MHCEYATESMQSAPSGQYAVMYNLLISENNLIICKGFAHSTVADITAKKKMPARAVSLVTINFSFILWALGGLFNSC